MSETRIVVEKTKTYQATNERFQRVGPVTMLTPRGEVVVGVMLVVGAGWL